MLKQLFPLYQPNISIWFQQKAQGQKGKIASPRIFASEKQTLSPFSTGRIWSRDSKQKQEFSNVLAKKARESTGCWIFVFALTSYEQIRLVKNWVKAVFHPLGIIVLCVVFYTVEWNKWGKSERKFRSGQKIHWKWTINWFAIFNFSAIQSLIYMAVKCFHSFLIV